MNELSGTAGLADRPPPGVAAIDFRALFEAAPNPYILLSPDFVIVEANAAYCAATLSERERFWDRISSKPSRADLTTLTATALRRSVARSNGRFAKSGPIIWLL